MNINKSFNERMVDIDKLKKDPNYTLLWCRHGNWLIEQAEKAERYEKALTKISTRKMSTYLTTSNMNQDFIKTANDALNNTQD
jgi:hypothetical protein